MFWIFASLAAGAATFTVLGMYAVWYKVLMIALMIALLIISGLTGFILWKKVYGKDQQGRTDYSR